MPQKSFWTISTARANRLYIYVRLLMLAVVSHFAFCYFNMSGFNPLDNLLFNATSIA